MCGCFASTYVWSDDVGSVQGWSTDLAGDVCSILGPQKIWSLIGHGIQAFSFNFQLQVSLIFFL